MFLNRIVLAIIIQLIEQKVVDRGHKRYKNINHEAHKEHEGKDNFCKNFVSFAYFVVNKVNFNSLQNLEFAEISFGYLSLKITHINFSIVISQQMRSEIAPGHLFYVTAGVSKTVTFTRK